MQRALPVKRRRVCVGSRSPTPVHYIDLTADSPVTTATTTTAASRRRHADSSNAKSSSSNQTNSGPSRQTETIDIVDTPDRIRSRTPRKNNKNLNKSSVIVSSILEDKLTKDSDDRIPAVNDSFDGLTPTVLSCPICYEDLRSSRKPMTTKCGHLFCESCIHTTLNSRKKCPVCMASITLKSCIRVHF